jgi:DNA-binding NtrC family response regulator
VKRVLIVDDEPSVRLALERILVGMDCEVVAAVDGLDAQDRLAQLDFDLVITDLSMPRADGFDVLRAVRELRPALPVIILTGQGSTQDCVRAMRAGAADFIGKPFHPGELQQVVRNALRSLAPDAAVDPWMAGQARLPQVALIGDSPQLRAVLDQVERIAHTDVGVVLVGERDTGRRAIVRLLHAMSPRAGKQLVTFDCAVDDQERLERELFASETAGGRLALAEGGTLLLSGLERLHDALRMRISRDVAQRLALGSSGPARADVRVVVSIDIDQANESEVGAFAAGLQEMFGAVMIAMPPLRERAQDVPLLVEYLIEAANRWVGRRVDAAPLLSALKQYSWPGNLTELEARISRYVTDAPVADVAEGTAAHSNVLAVPIERVTALLVLNDGTRHEVVLPRGPGQLIEELFEDQAPFVPVNEGGKTRIYARSALACVTVRDAGELEDDALPRNRRSVRVQLLSGVVLDGELRYVAVEGRGRVTDVLNESSSSFSLHSKETVHHIAKAHVLCIEEC